MHCLVARELKIAKFKFIFFIIIIIFYITNILHIVIVNYALGLLKFSVYLDRGVCSSYIK